MAAERKPGSDRGRPSIDWERAFGCWESLPDESRSYQAVAAEFGVSVRTVERHGRDGRWRERLQRIREDAAAEADADRARNRAEALSNVEKLIEASFTTYAHQLRAGTVRVVPLDLQRLFKLRQDLWELEAAATTEARNSHNDATPADDEDPEARKAEVIRALHEAGVFDRLLNMLEPADEKEDDSDERP